MAAFAIFAAFIVLAIVIRLFAGRLDGNRVGEYIRMQGGELIESRWSPFGRGWLGDKDDRIYQVRYRDRTGNIHQATVKTSMFSGVYFTEDRVVEQGSLGDSKATDLELENARLRARIAQLESRDPT